MQKLSLIALMAMLIGCERTPTAGPATKPGAGAQASAARIQAANPPTTGPVVRAPSVILIDQKPYSFPPAILQLRNRDGQVSAILMSDDPKEAINEDYRGNSFYLEMPLQIADAK